jgi:hypothetical protein
MTSIVGALAGVAIAGFGALNVKYSHEMARLEEQLDAIGSKRDIGTVEPADWKVTLTKGLGAVAVGVGAIIVAVSLLG